MGTRTFHRNKAVALLDVAQQARTELKAKIQSAIQGDTLSESPEQIYIDQDDIGQTIQAAQVHALLALSAPAEVPLAGEPPAEEATVPPLADILGAVGGLISLFPTTKGR